MVFFVLNWGRGRKGEEGVKNEVVFRTGEKGVGWCFGRGEGGVCEGRGL